MYTKFITVRKCELSSLSEINQYFVCAFSITAFCDIICVIIYLNLCFLKSVSRVVKMYKHVKVC